MAKRSSAFDDKLERLRAIRSSGGAAASTELERLLGDESPFVASLAAEIVTEQERKLLASAIGRTFRRVFGNEQPDRGCTVALACLKALEVFEVRDADLYTGALGMVRREPVGMDVVDVAMGVRIQAAYALARTEGIAATLTIMKLLGDPEPDVRAGVAEALGAIGSEAATAALYAKLLARDEDPNVMGALMRVLLRNNPAFFFPVVVSHLDDANETVAELAAVALGESRMPGALAPLSSRAAAISPRRLPSLLIAIALLRSDEAADYLAGLLASAKPAVALQAVGALKLFRDSPSLEKRVRQIGADRRNRDISAAIAAAFG